MKPISSLLLSTFKKGLKSITSVPTEYVHSCTTLLSTDDLQWLLQTHHEKFIPGPREAHRGNSSATEV